VDRVLRVHDQYWKTEDAMAEGSPVIALERGERVEMPPAIYLQAPTTRRIRAPISIASSRSTARPAARSSWSCFRVRPRGTSARSR